MKRYSVAAAALVMSLAAMVSNAVPPGDGVPTPNTATLNQIELDEFKTVRQDAADEHLADIYAAAKAEAEAKAAAEAKARAEAAAKKAAEVKRQRELAARQAAKRTAYLLSHPKEYARSLMPRYGWSSTQFTCLVKLWQRESNWNPRAHNPSSGAHGIPQALPGSKMASVASDWRTNPQTQIRWGLGYIKDRYGSPCRAWSFWRSHNWY